MITNTVTQKIKMPRNDRNKPVNPAHGRCVAPGCSGIGEIKVNKTQGICKDCHSDYLTYLPFMEPGQKPIWEN